MAKTKAVVKVDWNRPVGSFAALKTIKASDYLLQRLDELAYSNVEIVCTLAQLETAAGKNKGILECTGTSIAEAIITGIGTGLDISGRKREAYVVPVSERGKKVAQVWFDYRGEIKLIVQGGHAVSVTAQAVYDKDELVDIDLGTDCHVVIKPYLGPESRGGFKGFVAIARLKDGSSVAQYMTKTEVDVIRNRSWGKNSFMWTDNYGEAGKKTAVHRLAKYICKQTDDDRLRRLIDVESEQEERFRKTEVEIIDPRADFLTRVTVLCTEQGMDKTDLDTVDKVVGELVVDKVPTDGEAWADFSGEVTDDEIVAAYGEVVK